MRFLFLYFLFFVQATTAQIPVLHRVPGTKISLVAPDSFKLAKTFAGFEHEESGSSILVIEVKGPYKEMARAFTENPNQKRPFDIISIDSLTFQNFPALWMTLKQEAHGNIYFKKALLFGNDSCAVMIQGIFPQEASYLEPTISESVRSANFDKNYEIDPYETLAFTVEPQKFGFQLRNLMSGILTYTFAEDQTKQGTDGTDQKVKEPTLVIAPSIGKVTIADPKEYTIKRFRSLRGHETYAIEEVNAISIDSLEAYELLTKSPDAKIYSYMVMIFTGDNGYVLFAGHTEINHQEMINRYRNVLKTFRRK